ncbi:MAG: DEAD/DEAH box helicase family protein, partial [Bacteroidales bacterium]|nr:DEAD/DEAH box helicase family protein [Candidatus Colimorpha merdihippi]
FFKLIEIKRNAWFQSPSCPIKSLVDYMEGRGMMRDAQIEAIKTYLFLKIGCQNKPLWQLFHNGILSSPNSIALNGDERELFGDNIPALALMQYAALPNKNGKPLASELAKAIKSNPSCVDYEKAFRDLFYGVDYPDYLFSLPMGAGKTYLMAAFIYLDLYFAQNEPTNPIFAHNFMILAPSGLKSSIIPSLKKIQNFDPSWVLPEPAASNIRRMIKFEVLDEQKSAKKSNRIKNPNAQKLNMHLATEGENLMGLVAVTNAEKVILDRLDKDTQATLLSKDELDKMKVANELRHIIGQIPHLATFVDEVHHAADSEIKLRQVVTQWAESQNFNCMLGFSGTPYLEKAEKVDMTDTITISNTDLSNVVYHYPLIDGIGNFLKYPDIRTADADSDTIIRNGLTHFLDKFKDKVYPGGLCAKMAIYCGKIETLEERIYPLVSEILQAHHINPAEAVLKYHDGNKQYPAPEGAEAAFAALDTAMSRIRVVLLVQIGKEGWDCRSLTGVILSQQGDCPKNMVLQTSCRCLRQVERGKAEEAVIWLNKFNADTLNAQLSKTQNTSVKELNAKVAEEPIQISRYSRMEVQKVPPIQFYQLKVTYNTLTTEESPDTQRRLEEDCLVERSSTLVSVQDLEGNITQTYAINPDQGASVTFREWLNTIAKESLGTLPLSNLKKYEIPLRSLYDRLTVLLPDGYHYNERYDQERVRSLVRQAFVPRRDFTTCEEVITTDASLLQIEKLTSPVTTYLGDTRYHPDEATVQRILEGDKHQSSITPEMQQAIDILKANGKPNPWDEHPARRHTYHYLPYRFDSKFEKEYLQNALSCIDDQPLEVYYNGDDTLTEFKIDCFKHNGRYWVRIGKYVPDFLILSRNAEGGIHKVIIVETKGEGFAAKFADRRKFIETQFIKQNNEKFGYRRFEFLYIEDTLSPEKRKQKLFDAINEFFNNNHEG